MTTTTLNVHGQIIEGATPEHYIDARPGRGTGIAVIELLTTAFPGQPFGQVRALGVAAAHRKHPGCLMACRSLGYHFLN